MLKIWSISLGCPKNRVDTEHLLGALPVPFRPVSQMGRADVVFINTCGFIRPAVEESIKTILDAADRIGRVKKRPLLAVAGCMVGRYGAEELAKEIPEVDLWLSNQSLEPWGETLARRLGLGASVTGRVLSTPPSYAWLKISEGCRHACAFCTIPSIRGPHRSVPADELVREARSLLDRGVREIVLVAQDIAAWGTDIGEKHGLRTLIEQLMPLQGLSWLRMLYLYPSGITEDFMRFAASAGRPLLPYFDIPMQHAAPDVLRRMGRPFARHDPRAVVDTVRRFLPDAALRTSIIAGFPGETEEDFSQLLDFVRDTRFTHLGVFAYEPEDGTPAAVMPDQIPDAKKERRRDEIMEMQAEISAEMLESYVGQRMEVLVDAPHGEWPGLHTGRVWMQAPEIDGITYISGPGTVPGAMLEADIVESADYDLTALA